MTSELNWLVGPLLHAIERIDSDVNSNAIWDNPLVLDRFKSFIKRDKSSPQYRGDYISLVAGFDKMRYWSPVKYLADALQARGIVEMDGESLMGFVCFASLETNGTFLLAGIIDDAMCTQDPKNGPFSRESRMFGMYTALIFAGYRRNKDTGTGKVYGSSKEPRHQHHNRGSTAVLPIAGGKGLLSFEDSEKQKIVDRCKLVVIGMLDACAEAMHNMKEVRNNRGKTIMDKVCYDLYMKVQEIAGPGVAHIYSLNFIQVASMFGFLPYEFASWACVKSKTSGAYKAVNSLYQQHLSEVRKKTFVSSRHFQDLSMDDAQMYFASAVKWISQNVSYNFTHSLAENILCELNREEGTLDSSKEWAPSNKKDVLYFFKHRNGALHHLYRWKTDVRGIAILQVLLITPTGDINGIKDLSYLSSGGRQIEREDMSVAAYWSGDTVGTKAVTKESKYMLSDDYCQYFMSALSP